MDCDNKMDCNIHIIKNIIADIINQIIHKVEDNIHLNSKHIDAYYKPNNTQS